MHRSSRRPEEVPDGRSFVHACDPDTDVADGFDAWLRTPLPDHGVIENPSAMYTGWALDGTDPDWELNALADSPQAVAGIRAERSGTPLHLLARAPLGASTCSATGARPLRST
ncbi:hypothetical protein [Streptomyces sp. AC495_CC817]|uniref:hypothetical protein n=1 Tax=Streptomyces sp. AC495_CC817 TaxID=2823900 RepID=UPI001C2788EF|nr:hypothetical protein [Streptomyces sp. AC495_CC817]